MFKDGGAEPYAEPNAMILYKTIGTLPAMSVKDQVNSTRHWYHELARFALTSMVDAGGGGRSASVQPTTNRSASWWMSLKR